MCPRLAKELRIGDATVARCWRRFGLQPWRWEAFKFSTDPELEAKVRDVIGLCLDPPDKAVVLCVDEKSQIHALDRTAPILPFDLASPSATHDYVRHGTTTLFAAESPRRSTVRRPTAWLRTSTGLRPTNSQPRPVPVPSSSHHRPVRA